jgi:putative salt-induced outer membrane protein
MVTLAMASVAAAQAPATPPTTPNYTGNLGGGFAFTGGNTHTKNVNLTGALVANANARNVIKGTASYLRGTLNDVLNLDKTLFNFRDEYTVSNRTFVFGQLDYLRDQFKEINFFWAPTAGVGYKLINTDATQLILDGGAGGVLEKNPGIPASTSGSLTSGERFQQKLSAVAAFTEGLSTIWKTDDFGDSLTNFSTSVTTTVTSKVQLKVEVIDSYKHKPANLLIKRNDTAFVTTFVMKF